MPRLKTRSVDDLLTALPDWETLESFPSNCLFVAAAGFEDRTWACFDRWARGLEAGGIAILIEYPFNKEDNARQFEHFMKTAEARSIDLHNVRYDRASLYGEASSKLAELSPTHVVLDVSSVGSFAFFPLLSAILDSCGSAELSICYSEASEYYPSEAEWRKFQEATKDVDLVEKARLFDEHNFQSKGVDAVFDSPNYPGVNTETLPSRLVVIPNFSFSRVNRMVSHASECYRISRRDCEWILGLPPDGTTNGWRHDAIWELFERPLRRHSASTMDYKNALMALHGIWEPGRYKESLIVATIGSKAQHLALCLFLRMHPEIGLLLSEPSEFVANRFSSGGGSQWFLTFGSIDQLGSKLRGWDRVDFSWD
ncbi:MAG: hypothetical protein HQ559_08355 [Lentisphaerae bacterium]|nr:hypothetical protein [Lentisphaerota bacterium]